jgi:hypothetical protein
MHTHKHTHIHIHNAAHIARMSVRLRPARPPHHTRPTPDPSPPTTHSRLAAQPPMHPAAPGPHRTTQLPLPTARRPAPATARAGRRRGASARSCKGVSRKRLQHAAERRCGPSASLLDLQCRRKGLHRTRGEVNNETCKKWGDDEQSGEKMQDSSSPHKLPRS